MTKNIYIKKWFMAKNNINELRVITPEMIVRETEKAILVNFDLDGKREMWIPKSCTMTADEYIAENDEDEDRMAAGLERNQMLLEQAKAAGVKGVRKGMRTATIIEKMKAAGIEV